MRFNIRTGILCICLVVTHWDMAVRVCVQPWVGNLKIRMSAFLWRSRCLGLVMMQTLLRTSHLFIWEDVTCYRGRCFRSRVWLSPSARDLGGASSAKRHCSVCALFSPSLTAAELEFCKHLLLCGPLQTGPKDVSYHASLVSGPQYSGFISISLFTTLSSETVVRNHLVYLS